MGTLLTIVASKLLPMIGKNKKKKGNESNSMLMIKTVGYWGLLAILLFAMSKGVLSLKDVESVIEVIKE